MTPRPYTPQEDAYICAEYSRQPLTAIAAYLGRPYRAVSQHASVLRKRGLLALTDRYGRPPWTEEDEEYLADNWGRLSDAAIARHLGRSVSAVTQRAELRRLARRGNIWTAADAARLFGVDSATIRRWLAQGWITGRHSPLRVGRGRAWSVDEDSLEAFVRERPWAYAWRRMTRGEYLSNLAETLARADPWVTLPVAGRMTGLTITRLRRCITWGLLPHQRRRIGQLGPHQGEIVVRQADLAGLPERYAIMYHAQKVAGGRKRQAQRRAKRQSEVAA